MAHNGDGGQGGGQTPEALLQAELLQLAGRGEAAFLFAADATLVWCTGAAATMLGARSPAEIAGKPSEGERWPAARITELAGHVAPVTGTRLERLRVVAGRRADVLTLACRRIVLGSGRSLLLAVAMGRKPVLVGSASGTASDIPDILRAGPTGPAPEPLAAAPEGPLTIDDLRRRAGRTALRVLWRSDPEGRFEAISPELEELLGQGAGPSPGETVEQAASRGLLDAGSRFGSALVGRETFTGVTLLCPAIGYDGYLPVVMSGVPSFGPDRRFEGFRGFGVCRLEALVDASGEVLGSAAPKQKPSAEPQAGTPTDVPAAERGESAAVLPFPPVHGVVKGQLAGTNVVPIKPSPRPGAGAPAARVQQPGLSRTERNAFREIARALGARVEGDEDEEAPPAPPALGPIGTRPSAPAETEQAAREPLPQDAAVEEMPGGQPSSETAEAPLAAGGTAPESTVAGEAVPSEHDGAAASQAGDAFVAPHLDEAGEAEPVGEHPCAATRADSEDEAALPADAEEGTDEDALADRTAAAAAEFESATVDPVDAAEATVPADEDSAAGTPELDTAPAALPVQEPAPPEEPSLAAAMAASEPAKNAASAQVAPAEPPFEEIAANVVAIFDRLPIGILVSRGDVPIVMNRTLLDLTGYEDIDAFHADGGLPHLFRAAADREPGPEGATLTITTRDGEAMAVDARLQTVTWSGLPATLVSFRRAVDPENERKLRALEATLARRDREARELRAIMDTATDGVIVVDEEGRIVSINRSGEALFGYDQAELAGETFITLFAPDSHATALDYLEGLRANGVASVLNDGREVVGRVRQGGRIPLFMTLGAISDAPERKFCAVLRDITSWKKAELDLTEAKRAAEEASAQKSDFLAKISHEIRTPLSAIIGFAEVMIEERFGPIGNERYLEYLRDIHASGGHVISLVNDLLDLSKIEAGRFDLTFTSVDVNEIVTRAVALMQPQAGTSRVVVRTALSARLPRVVADERSLRQIVLNLLSNGIKFTDPGGQVIVSTALTDQGEVAVRIRDTGIGMTEKEIETALEPFRQVATARRAGGTGLGLPLTKALVEANRASLLIRSARDAGTLVEVLFPTTRVLAE